MRPLRSAPDPAGVADRVRTLLGPEGVEARIEGEGGPGRGIVARPSSDEEASSLLRVAGESGWRVWPEGAGVARAFGPGGGRGAGSGEGCEGGAPGPSAPAPGPAAEPPAAPDLVISTLAMDHLREHEPADLVAGARAGMRLEAFQAEVGKASQWLALDPPGGSRVTMGGLVSEGSAGPLRVMYGRPRDQLLGLTLVDGSGRVLSLGGRVVKNVAGFDLVRLASGSRGTLGLITEVVFRLHPLPEADRTLIWSRETPGEAWSLGRALATLPLPLAATELLGGGWDPPLDGSGPRVLIRLQGSKDAVAEIEEALHEVGGSPSRVLGGVDSREAARVLSEGNGAHRACVRIHTLPDRMGSVLPGMEGVGWDRYSVHLLNGTLRGRVGVGGGTAGRNAPGHDAPDQDAPGREASGRHAPEREAAGWDELASQVAAAGGVLRLPGGAPRGRDGLSEVGTSPSPGVRALESRIRSAFDPSGILPGAWWGGGR